LLDEFLAVGGVALVGVVDDEFVVALESNLSAHGDKDR
jgi:hypothetical protein